MLCCAQHDSGMACSPPLVTLSVAKGLTRGAGMLRCAQHDSVVACSPPLVTLSVAKGLSQEAQRCFAALSMTGLYFFERSFR